MRQLCFGILCLGITVGLQAAERAPAIGDKIGELKFKDIRSLERTLTDFGPKQAYVLVFTTTECPIVNKSIPKLIDLDQRFSPRDVQIVAVNVGPADTILSMAAQAVDYDAAFPFVKDMDLSCVKALGVERTPEVAVLNADRILVYRGRIDDQFRLGGTRTEPRRKDLEAALNELLDGQKLSVTTTPVDGCLITEPEPINTNLPAPQFHRDVAAILNQKCVSCHREGTGAPFSLTSYADATAHAEMIAEVISDQRMPPWYANPKHGTFQNDPSLTRRERDTLLRWVKSSRAEGDPKDAPEAPVFPETKWRIGEPDLVLTTVEEDTIPPTGFIPYRNVLLPHVFLNETWVEAVEIRPMNPAVVHHCNMAYVTSKGAGNHTFITGHVPGGLPMDLSSFDNGVAYKIPQWATLGLQIHYTTTGKEEKCRIQVAFRFPRRAVDKQLKHFVLDPRDFQIEPGNGAYPVRSSLTFEEDVTLLGLFTHMHVRGKDMTFFATIPDQPRQTLLQIPNFNFEWQLGYKFAPGQKRFPKGTVLEAIAHYDNSTFNPYNPDPKRTVPYGDQTYDEMFNGYGFYVADDEHLNLTIDPKTGAAKKSVASSK
ncbi:MAG: redoxin family protein [Planctomycetaceae bacterium]